MPPAATASIPAELPNAVPAAPAPSPEATGSSASAAAAPSLPAPERGMARGLWTLRLFIVLCVAVALLLFGAFAVYRWQQMLEEAEVRLVRSLSIAHEHALRVLDTNEILARHVLDLVRDDDDARLLQRQDALHLQLVELARNKPQVESIWVTDAQGGTVATNRFAKPPEGRNVADRPYFQWHRDKKGGVFVSAAMKGTAPGDRFFNLSRGRYRADGSFAGVVSVGLHAGYFTRFHEELAADEPGLAITVFRNDGEVYSRWPPLPGAPERMSPRGEVLSRVIAGETSGVVRSVSSLDGQKRVIFFRKLGDYPVYIGTGRELSAIRTEFLRELGRVAAIAALPALGLLWAAWLALRRTREALDAAHRLHEESQARRQIEEALLQSQKMEALGRLTGGVVHDFNNALMVISGNLHLLRLAQPAPPAKFTDAIGRAVESATKLTRQLLAFSRRQALAPETFSLQERLPPMRDLLAPTLGSKIPVEIAIAPDTAPIHVDPAEFELALINLAVNARDAMEAGGQLTITARNAPDAAGWVWVEAIDTGQGMDPATAAKAFDPFFTTKPLGKGTGLGLSQVHALCKRAGGDASLESRPGAGTTVRMKFPASTGPVAPSAAPDSLPAKIDARVLLVEDNAEVAAVIVPVLKRLGCHVVHRESADAAVDWLSKYADEVDVLLTDVVMPGERDGLALAREVSAQHPRIRILVMTGYAEQIDAISRLGFGVLPKPFAPRSLAEAMERVLASPAGTAPL
ncbi:ATP-binding protein [Ramlibacter sp.]|uniref:hybrid sensor histidine kinase/response regulator n=1 Tax=Ramlibacter sp. TaxID=1917967 RepID=UPI003D0F9A8C